MVPDDTFWRVVTIFALIVAGLFGLFVNHIIGDAKARAETAKSISEVSERTASLESDGAHHREEIKGLREDRHDFKDDIKRATWELIEARFERFTDALTAFKAEVLRLLGK